MGYSPWGRKESDNRVTSLHFASRGLGLIVTCREAGRPGGTVRSWFRSSLRYSRLRKGWKARGDMFPSCSRFPSTSSVSSWLRPVVAGRGGR